MNNFWQGAFQKEHRLRYPIAWDQNATMPHRATFRFSWALDAFTFVGLFLCKIILKIIFITALI